MNDLNNLEKVKLLTGESDESLLSLLLEDAKEYVLGYTGRTAMVPALEKTVRDLAVIAYNRMGTEGESSRSGGGESYSFDSAPKQIYDILDRFRLVRIGGRAYEAKKEPSGEISPQGGDSEER